MRKQRYLYFVAFAHVGLTSALAHQGTFIGMGACSSKYADLPSMTLEQCKSLCGDGWGPYDRWDVISSIVTWVTPLFVLVGNMHFSHFDVVLFKQRPLNIFRKWLIQLGNSLWGFVVNYGFVILHVLGDPIDVIWSFLEQLHHIHTIRALVRKRLGCLSLEDQEHVIIVLVALADFNFGYTGKEKFEDILIDCLLIEQDNRKKRLIGACRSASVLLAVTRVKNSRRSGLAIIAYVSLLYTQLANARAAKTAAVHIPHTIALRELYYWLIPAITLSAAAGAFPTHWTAYAALQPVMDALREFASYNTLELGALKPWSGGIYCFRPAKRFDGLSSVRWFSMAFISVASAWGISFCISWFTPTIGLGCRAMTELSYFLAWITSVFLTSLFAYLLRNRTDHRRLFMTIYIKDAVLGLPMTLVLFLAFEGWWNSCECWASPWTVARGVPMIPLRIAQTQMQLGGFYYGMIGAGLGVQVLLTIAMLMMHRRSLNIIYDGDDKVRKIHALRTSRQTQVKLPRIPSLPWQSNRRGTFLYHC